MPAPRHFWISWRVVRICLRWPVSCQLSVVRLILCESKNGRSWQGQGFVEAFDTPPQWQYTAFLPSNEAFNNTGAYYSTYAKTLKGKHWLGNVLQVRWKGSQHLFDIISWHEKHHYIPNSQLKLSTFNSTLSRIQTASFLYVSTQNVGGTLTLNNAAKVTTGDLPVTSVSTTSSIYDRFWESMTDEI